jgi:hypothetical protein
VAIRSWRNAILLGRFERHNAVHPAALGWPLSLQFESKFGEELVAAARSSTMPMCFICWISMCFYGHYLYGKSNPAAFAGNARIH